MRTYARTLGSRDTPLQGLQQADSGRSSRGEPRDIQNAVRFLCTESAARSLRLGSVKCPVIPIYVPLLEVQQKIRKPETLGAGGGVLEADRTGVTCSVFPNPNRSSVDLPSSKKITPSLV